MLNLRLLEKYASLNDIRLGTKIIFKDSNGKEHEINNIQYIVDLNDNKIILSEEDGNLIDKE